MTGACVDPVLEDPYVPPSLVGRTPCGEQRQIVGVDAGSPAGQGPAQCQRVYCGCESRDCQNCTATFVAWGGPCALDDRSCVLPAVGPGGGTPRDAGPPTDGGDAGVDAGDAEPLPGPSHRILSYEFGGGPIAATPTVEMEVPDELLPIAAMVTDSKLWVVSEGGMLARYDVGAGAIDLGPVNLGLTNITSLDVFSRPITPGTWLLVGAANGVHLFSVSGSSVVLRESVPGMFVTDAARHTIPALRDPVWASFVSTMPNAIWVVQGMDSTLPVDRIPATSPLAFTPGPISVENIDPAFLWTGGPAGIMDRWRSRLLAFESNTMDLGPIVGIDGSQFFNDASLINNMLVVAIDRGAGGQTEMLSFVSGNPGDMPSVLSLDGRFVGLSTRKIGPELLAFVVTSTPGTMRVLYPTAPSIILRAEQTIPPELLPVAFTTGIHSRPPEMPPAGLTAFLHVAVRVLP
ncbi:MAG: hypothetical protein M3Q39_04755 [Actinomycetota bacterium]|nr:hypothetical protein [Actinomycetota bacterium]